jgi:hypothetical protein
VFKRRGGTIMLIKRGYVMKKETLTLRFKGENDIDIETLSKSLDCVVAVLGKIADSSISENDFCKFKVKNIEKGSFMITIEQIVEMAAVLFPLMPPILESFNSIVELKKNLGGQMPAEVIHEGNNTIVKSCVGNVTYIDNRTYNLYTRDSSIEKCLSELSRTISEDGERTGFSIAVTEDKTVKTVEMDKEDLMRTRNPIDVESLNGDITEQEATEVLTVRKPDLLGNSKWQFKFLGKTINADIEDEKFFEKSKGKRD